MGCGASSGLGDGLEYPGAGREERKAQAEWEGGGDSFGAADAAELLQSSEWQQGTPTTARAASQSVLRRIREKEWGAEVCEAYYAYLNAAEEDAADDWNGNRGRRDQGGGTELQGAAPAKYVEGGGGKEPATPPTAPRAPANTQESSSPEQLQRLESHRKLVEKLEGRQRERDAVRKEVLAEVAERMMGLQDDPRVVLQVLGVPCEGGTRPSDEQLLRGLRKALIRHHPDRRAHTAEDVKGEVEAEEVFKLLVRLRDDLREDMAQEGQL